MDNDYVIKDNFILNNCHKTGWLENISRWCLHLHDAISKVDSVLISLGANVKLRDFTPFHIVTLSCFIEFVKQKGYMVYLHVEDEWLKSFIYNDMSITRYWREEKSDHIDSPSLGRLNLWRVANGRAEEYEMSVHRYFSNKFPKTDFTVLKICLIELYYNVFDHADAHGIAFSYIHYDEEKEVIRIAICDFGRGIAKTVRGAYPNVQTDKEALLMSLRKGVSARSNSHNSGFGLDNVVSSLSEQSTLRMVSNNGLLICTKNAGCIETKTFDLPFHWNGSLIYFDLPISNFELTEVNDTFMFD